jgi:hypothetical protein
MNKFNELYESIKRMTSATITKKYGDGVRDVPPGLKIRYFQTDELKRLSDQLKDWQTEWEFTKGPSWGIEIRFSADDHDKMQSILSKLFKKAKIDLHSFRYTPHFSGKPIYQRYTIMGFEEE